MNCRVQRGPHEGYQFKAEFGWRNSSHRVAPRVSFHLTAHCDRDASATLGFRYCLGASPSSISYNELYSALQTHVVDGQENPIALIGTGKLYEVQKYCALSNHCWSGFWIVGNPRAMAGLPQPLREILDTHLDAAAIKERADLIDLDRSMQAELTNRGMVFNTPDPAPFRAALRRAGFFRWQWDEDSESQLLPSFRWMPQ